jgi:hypothetical protein
MPDTPTPDPATRIAELEAEVARLTYERNVLQSIVSTRPLGDDGLPELTEEDFLAAMQNPSTASLDDLIAECRRKVEGS